MIKFYNLRDEEPYKIFKDEYDKALKMQQKNIEAIAIASFSKPQNEVNSRFVNLKFIDDDKFIFFTNYLSPKSKEFEFHDQISVVLFWQNTNIQIRLKAKIKKTSTQFNKEYFKKRMLEKNALSISSSQSEPIASHEDVVRKYQDALKAKELSVCPDYWGGYCFTPYVFEFWEGNKFRLNKRDMYSKDGDKWIHSILEP